MPKFSDNSIRRFEVPEAIAPIGKELSKPASDEFNGRPRLVRMEPAATRQQASRLDQLNTQWGGKPRFDTVGGNKDSFAGILDQIEGEKPLHAPGEYARLALDADPFRDEEAANRDERSGLRIRSREQEVDANELREIKPHEEPYFEKMDRYHLRDEAIGRENLEKFAPRGADQRFEQRKRIPLNPDDLKRREAQREKQDAWLKANRERIETARIDRGFSELTQASSNFESKKRSARTAEEERAHEMTMARNAFERSKYGPLNKKGMEAQRAKLHEWKLRQEPSSPDMTFDQFVEAEDLKESLNNGVEAARVALEDQKHLERMQQEAAMLARENERQQAEAQQLIESARKDGRPDVVEELKQQKEGATKAMDKVRKTQGRASLFMAAVFGTVMTMVAGTEYFASGDAKNDAVRMGEPQRIEFALETQAKAQGIKQLVAEVGSALQRFLGRSETTKPFNTPGINANRSPYEVQDKMAPADVRAAERALMEDAIDETTDTNMNLEEFDASAANNEMYNTGEDQVDPSSREGRDYRRMLQDEARSAKRDQMGLERILGPNPKDDPRSYEATPPAPRTVGPVSWWKS